MADDSITARIKNLLPSKRTNEKQQYEPKVPQLPDYAEPVTVNDGLFEDDPIGGEGPFPKIEDNSGNVIDQSLMRQPSYEENQIQLMNDIASDESLGVLTYYIQNLSQLGNKAQARLVTRATAFQSKNQVFSNIENQRDYLMAQDDFEYAKILSKADFTSFDMNADYYVAEAIMEAQFNIRLRRSKRALNLLQLNTQRSESGPTGGYHQQQEKQGILQKLSFLGGNRGGGY